MADKFGKFYCKDCDQYNLCEYYHNRRKTSQICTEFRREAIQIERIKQLREEIASDNTVKCWDEEQERCLAIIDKYTKEAQR